MTEIASDVLPSLAENEAVIERGMGTFIEVGQALTRIRDDMQYVSAGFDTFEEYCRKRWDMSADHAGNLCGAAQIPTIVGAAGLPAPGNEWTARPLVRLMRDEGDEAVRQAWAQIVEHHDGEGPITGAEVRRFLQHGASAHRPGWFELLGQVGDDLIAARKHLDRAENAITRRPKAELRAKAAQYADWADDVAGRLRGIAE